MNRGEIGSLSRQGKSSAVNLYCMAALVADEASRNGYGEFARSIETALGGMLSGLPREEQKLALRMSYEMSLGGGDPAPPRLRLVYSRD